MYNKENPVKKRVPVLIVGNNDMKSLLYKYSSLKDKDCFSLVARVGPFTINLITNSNHLALFWKNNWPKALLSQKYDATIYALITSTTKAPEAKICPELRQALILNTQHYNQVKSMAIGFASYLGERGSSRKKYLFILGSLFSYKRTGVCLIGPSKTGKTTLTSLFCMREPQARFIANDPFYVDHAGCGFRMERAIHMRTDISLLIPEWGDAIKNSLLQNADSNFLQHSRTSYCVVRPEELFGAQKLTSSCSIDIIFLLQRNYEIQEIVRPLSFQEAFHILQKGEYRYYELPAREYASKAKPRLVRTKNKPYYNSALFYRESIQQRKLYERFLRGGKFFSINTIGDIELTLLLIKNIILEYRKSKTIAL